MKDIAATLVSLKAVIAILALAAAYLAHSPLGSKLPKQAAKALAWISRLDTTALFDLLGKLTMSREERREAAVKWLMEQTAGGPVPLTERDAEALADYVQKEFDAGKKWLQARGK